MKRDAMIAKIGKSPELQFAHAVIPAVLQELGNCKYEGCQEGHFCFGYHEEYDEYEWGACPCCDGRNWKNCPNCDKPVQVTVPDTLQLEVAHTRCREQLVRQYKVYDVGISKIDKELYFYLRK
jgi:hypothetical protein